LAFRAAASLLMVWIVAPFIRAAPAFLGRFLFGAVAWSAAGVFSRCITAVIRRFRTH
jgi:hypothetical protein